MDDASAEGVSLLGGCVRGEGLLPPENFEIWIL